MQQFVSNIEQSIHNNTFVRLTLSAPLDKNHELKKLIIRLIELKKNITFSYTYRYQTRDITKNFPIQEGLIIFQEMMRNVFSVATLFTLQNDIVIEKRDSEFRIKIKSPEFKTLPERGHDRNKKRHTGQQNRMYLSLLGLADEKGNIYASGQDKYKQINQYIEILSTRLKDVCFNKPVNVIDMGSGKGYLTFALYDYITTVLKSEAQITGIEQRKDLVDLCNNAAQKSDFKGLQFIQSRIEDYAIEKTNILIALHACDTATDEAIFKGIQSDTQMIVTAPCCHNQIRRELENSNKKSPLDFITRHGIFEERQAEMITDAIRALILEHYGYMVKIVEFIADAHTHKNVMIIAVKTSKGKSKAGVIEQIHHIKQMFGIRVHALEQLCDLTNHSD